MGRDYRKEHAPRRRQEREEKSQRDFAVGYCFILSKGDHGFSRRGDSPPLDSQGAGKQRRHCADSLTT